MIENTGGFSVEKVKKLLNVSIVENIKPKKQNFYP